MASLAFDTCAFVKALTQAGMPEEQAEVLARSQATVLDEKLATKRDLKEPEARLTHDLRELEMRMTPRLGSMMVVAVGVVAGEAVVKCGVPLPTARISKRRPLTERHCRIFSPVFQASPRERSCVSWFGASA